MQQFFKQLAITNKSNQIFLKCTPFIVGTIGIILISSFSQKLTSIDKGIASWALSQTSVSTPEYYFNTDLIKILNNLVYAVPFFTITIIGYNFITQLCIFKLRGRQNIYQIVFPIVSFTIYFVFSMITLMILKKTYQRPRPCQTIQFRPQYMKHDISCQIPFQPAFRKYNGDNLCNYALESCPSGHTLLTTISMVGMVYYCYFQIKQSRYYQDVNGQKINVLFNVVCDIILVFSVILMTIFIPTVMIARMAVLKHFFSDVCGGLCLGIVFFSIVLLMEPNISNNKFKCIKVRDALSQQGIAMV